MKIEQTPTPLNVAGTPEAAAALNTTVPQTRQMGRNAPVDLTLDSDRNWKGQFRQSNSTSNIK